MIAVRSAQGRRPLPKLPIVGNLYGPPGGCCIFATDATDSIRRPSFFSPRGVPARREVYFSNLSWSEVRAQSRAWPATPVCHTDVWRPLNQHAPLRGTTLRLLTLRSSSAGLDPGNW